MSLALDVASLVLTAALTCVTALLGWVLLSNHRARRRIERRLDDGDDFV